MKMPKWCTTVLLVTNYVGDSGYLVHALDCNIANLIV